MIATLCVKLIEYFENCVRITQNRGLDGGFGHPIPIPTLEVLGTWGEKDKKKAIEGRMYKLYGDYCMLAGCPLDASGHYSNAIKRSSKIDDYLWYVHCSIQYLPSSLSIVLSSSPFLPLSLIYPLLLSGMQVH